MGTWGRNGFGSCMSKQSKLGQEGSGAPLKAILGALPADH